jgi:glycosyltransferase involved in cell wall biosynthesis
MVDAYIAMTETMRDKFVQGGFSPEKIFVKSNFLEPDPLPGRGDGNFALFVGRLNQEKGIETLLKAWEIAKPDFPLKVLGTGPLKDFVTASARSPSVEYLGWQSEEEVLKLMGSARFIVIPTEWYEGHPRTAVEALACGRPIIASRIGAMTEMIEDGRSGLMFTPGDADDLAAKLRWAMEHDERMAEMGREGRSLYTRRYTAPANYPQLRAIYQHVIAARQDAVSAGRTAGNISEREARPTANRGQVMLNDVEL